MKGKVEVYFFNMSATHDSAQPLGVSGCFLHHKEGERQRAPCTVAGPWSCLLSPNSLPPTPHSGSSQPSAGFAASDTSGSCRIPAVGPPVTTDKRNLLTWLVGTKPHDIPPAGGGKVPAGWASPARDPTGKERRHRVYACAKLCAHAFVRNTSCSQRYRR